MKKKILISTLLLLAALVAFCYISPKKTRKVLPSGLCDALHIPKPIPGSYIATILSAEDWNKPEDAIKKVTSMVEQRLKGTTSDDVDRFMREPENRLLLADAAMLSMERGGAERWGKIEEQRRQNLEKLRKQLKELQDKVSGGAQLPAKHAETVRKLSQRIGVIEAELAAKHRFPDLPTTEHASLPPIAELVGSNLDWASQLSSTGEYTHTAEALAILDRIAEKNPEMPYRKMERNIATATAVEFARQGLAQDDAVNRAHVITRAWKDGKLNKSFDKLPFWQLRVICGLKGRGVLDGAGGNDKSGSVESLKYGQQNVHLPAYRYTGACWQAPYRSTNIFGDSVQGPFYHAPFYGDDSFGDNFNDITRTVGGVCGGLSHYGATVAIANGVPAMTAGEPSHCSYVVLVDGKWTPAYSLSWQRGLHWTVFADVHCFGSLHMADKLFSSAEKGKTDLSQAQLKLANLYAQNDPKKAKEFYIGAIKSQPANYYAWRDYADFLREASPQDATQWIKLCDLLNSLLAREFPEMTATIFRQLVYPSLEKLENVDKAELHRVVFDFWDKVQEMCPDPEWDKSFHGRWRVEEFLAAQLHLMGIDPAKDDAALDFLRSTLSATAGKTAYSTVLLSWGTELCNKLPDARRTAFLGAMTGALSGSGGGGSDEDREKLLSPVILAAEAAGDLSSFNSLAASLPEKYKRPETKMPSIEPFSEQLVSQGGMIHASSTSGFDHPCAHWGVLEPGVGGAFHTGKDKDAWVVVTLPKQANLTGVVIVATQGNWGRLHNMKIQVSESGRDNDWHDVAQLGQCTQRVLRADLNTSRPLAKFVRILRPGGPEFFHLLGIYVYGKPAA